MKDTFNPDNIDISDAYVTKDYSALFNIITNLLNHRSQLYPHLSTEKNAVYKYVKEVIDNKKQEEYVRALHSLNQSLGQVQKPPTNKSDKEST